MRKNVAVMALLLLIAFCIGLFAGTHAARLTPPAQDNAVPVIVPTKAGEKNGERPITSAFAGRFVTSAPTATEQDPASQEIDGNSQSSDRAYTTWNEEEFPHYYRIVGEAELDSDLQPGEVSYSGLDHLGRSGRAIACVTYDLMAAGIARNRGDMSSIAPTGWGHNEEVDIELPDGSYYHGFLYNRSHLIAKSLGGSDIQENLVTGTRMQNVGANNPAGGMLFCEQTARNWLESNPEGWILYSATPIYEGDELVCRSVIVNMLSSDGSINMQVEVYNAALGFEIDYATGEFTTNDQ